MVSITVNSICSYALSSRFWRLWQPLTENGARSQLRQTRCYKFRLLTWLFYTVVDLGDAVADEMEVPFDSIFQEMLHRGMYHFAVAYNKGKARDRVSYFAALENQDLRVVKIRKKEPSLDLSPFPRPHLTFDSSS